MNISKEMIERVAKDSAGTEFLAFGDFTKEEVNKIVVAFARYQLWKKEATK